MTGKIDYLRGLKENVVVGRLIPAGTGMEFHDLMAAKKASDSTESMLSEDDYLLFAGKTWLIKIINNEANSYVLNYQSPNFNIL